MTIWLICAVSFVGTMLGVFFVKKIVNHQKFKLIYFYLKLVSLYWTRNRPCIGQGIVQKVSEKLTFPSTFVEKKKTLSLLKRALSSMAASPVLYGEYRALHYANEVENSKVQGFAFQHLANEFKKKTLVEYYASQFCSEEMNHDKILANFPQAILLKLEFLNIFFKTEQVPGKKLVSFIIFG